MKLGISIQGKRDGAAYCKLIGKVFDFVIFNTKDLHQSIKKLRDISAKSSKVARLAKGSVYMFDGKTKSIEAAFALLYDFVDYFVIAAFDELTEDIDPIVNLRLYYDDFKPIYLEIPDNMLKEELDETIAYSKLSNIDGLVISDPELAGYASEKAGDLLSIVMLNVNDEEKLAKAIGLNATAVSIQSGKLPCLQWFKGRKLKRKLNKMSS